ncbi:hypothetical protein F0562_018938 [Nyssa sinensis]|uniref:F-box domain-containing protein n=1 Tax=Nyssa sinensis TaxID=561372 RepID=A0A5J4ZDS4_9ASTE|nr:hypothetical protein F0562_018938 [Nyssa sinensis]
MGNIVHKCLGCSSKKSLHCLERSKIPHARNANKQNTFLEKQETADNKKKEKKIPSGRNANKDNTFLVKQKTTDNKKNEKKTVPVSQPSVALVPVGQPSIALVPVGQPSIALVPITQPSVPSVPVTQPSVPNEIIIEILSWLPVKILVRLKCVCKQWYTLIQDRHSIEKNMSRTTSVSHQYNKIVATLSRDSYQVICGCDGLLLTRSSASNKHWIQNPTTCQMLELPDPHEGSFGITFSFIPSTSNYKLVSVYDDKEEPGDEGCEVLTVGSAAVHCVRVFNVGSNIYEEVVSLDLETECFTITALPQGLNPDWEALDWDGKLSLASRVKEDLYVMVLEDYKKHKWGAEIGVVPLGFMKENQDMDGHLIPLYARGGNLWFWLEDKKIFAYNIGTRKITHRVPAAEGYGISKTFYCCPPSLATMKGMRPRK